MSNVSSSTQAQVTGPGTQAENTAVTDIANQLGVPVAKLKEALAENSSTGIEAMAHKLGVSPDLLNQALQGDVVSNLLQGGNIAGFFNATFGSPVGNTQSDAEKADSAERALEAISGLGIFSGKSKSLATDQPQLQQASNEEASRLAGLEEKMSELLSTPEGQNAVKKNVFLGGLVLVAFLEVMMEIMKVNMMRAKGDSNMWVKEQNLATEITKEKAQNEKDQAHNEAMKNIGEAVFSGLGAGISVVGGLKSLKLSRQETQKVDMMGEKMFKKEDGYMELAQQRTIQNQDKAIYANKQSPETDSMLDKDGVMWGPQDKKAIEASDQRAIDQLPPEDPKKPLTSDEITARDQKLAELKQQDKAAYGLDDHGRQRLTNDEGYPIVRNSDGTVKRKSRREIETDPTTAIEYETVKKKKLMQTDPTAAAQSQAINTLTQALSQIFTGVLSKILEAHFTIEGGDLTAKETLLTRYAELANTMAQKWADDMNDAESLISGFIAMIDKVFDSMREATKGL